jgi:hypothetical protein
MQLVFDLREREQDRFQRLHVSEALYVTARMDSREGFWTKRRPIAPLPLLPI